MGSIFLRSPDSAQSLLFVFKSLVLRRPQHIGILRDRQCSSRSLREGPTGRVKFLELCCAKLSLGLDIAKLLGNIVTWKLTRSTSIQEKFEKQHVTNSVPNHVIRIYKLLGYVLFVFLVFLRLTYIFPIYVFDDSVEKLAACELSQNLVPLFLFCNVLDSVLSQCPFNWSSLSSAQCILL